jgi:L-fuconolactonase
VLDHLGKAPIASGEVEPWASGLRELAAEHNVWCKLSGIHTIAAPGAGYADLAPFVEVAMEAFSPGRMMFGSDWPVSLQRASYADVVATATTACAALSPTERSAVLGGNARDVYRLA